jgi:hypothetical protein
MDSTKEQENQLSDSNESLERAKPIEEERAEPIGLERLPEDETENNGENEEQKQARNQEALIAWRRAQVWELLAKGYSQTEIAKKLKVSDPTVHRDVKFLTEEAWGKKEDATQQIFLEQQKALAGITLTIRTLWGIAEDEKRGPGERMQATTMILKAYETRLGMVSGKNAGRVIKGDESLIEVYEEQRDRALKERGTALRDLEKACEKERLRETRLSFLVDSIERGDINAKNIGDWYNSRTRE